MFENYLSFVGEHGMLMFLSVGAIGAVYFFIQTIRWNRRAERDRIAGEF